jgi:flagellar M-ring protein FliF
MATATQLAKTSPHLAAQPTLAGRLAGLWGRTRVAWAQLAPAQRTRSLVAFFLLASLTGGLLWYLMRTDWRTLYTGLDPDDARQISQTLTTAQVPFDLAADGGTIRVPAPDLDKARLATAAKGGVKSGRLGFEIFDKPNWVGSEFDEQVNYQRALEGELEHTVATLSDVESARVHLVMPHDSLFREEERPAKASVVLKMRHGSLADGEPEAIRNLVASAVDGLTPDHVVLVDADGRYPLGPKTPEGSQLSAEQGLEDKLVATLEPVTGMGNVRASVVLDYDPSATETTQETYDPTQTVTLSMQRSQQSSGPQPVAAGVPGTASNAPNSQALPVYPQQSSQPQTATSESGTYATSKTVKHVVENPGRIRRLTAAIVVNDRLVAPAVKNKAAVWQPRSADELRQLTALAQTAIGFDLTRGDALTVQDLAFDQNRPQPAAPLPTRMISAAEGSPLLIKYGALLVGLLVVLALGVRPAMHHAASVLRDAGGSKPRELSSASTHAAAAAALAAAPPAEADPERMRSQAMFEQVTSHVKREPTQTSRLLQSWIHSD